MSASRSAQDSVRDQLVAAAVREPDPSRVAQSALRDALVAAAVREQGENPAPAPRRRRRRRRRTAGLVVIGLLGAAGVAQGTGLISVGTPIEPKPGDSAYAERYKNPVPGGGDLVLQADDPDNDLNWGVAIYTSAEGKACVIAGQVRGNRLGLERAGTFRPYGDRQSGGCADLDRTPLHVDVLAREGTPPRTVVFGRAADPRTPVTLRLKATGEVKDQTPARGGAFLFVLDGSVGGTGFDIRQR